MCYSITKEEYFNLKKNGDIMINRVYDEEKARACDDLLTKLIQDERNYDNSIEKDFVVKDYFKNVIKNKNNILLCFEEDNIIKGYVYIKPINVNNRKGYLIDGLYVEKDYRNNKIATKLIDEAIKIIENTDAKFIDINVLANNEIARKLYKHLNFNEFKISMRKEF